MTVLHQATDSVTGQVYTWTADVYDNGAGYPGPNSPRNILVTAGLGPGRDMGSAVLPGAVPANQVWRTKSDGTTPVRAHVRYSVKCYPWLATGDGTTDDTAAVTQYINDMQARGEPVYFPAGNYKITAALPYIMGGTQVVGEGKSQTTITFDPTTDAVLFQFNTDVTHPTLQYRCSIVDMTITCGTGTTHKRTAIKVRDVSEWRCHNVAVNFAPGAGPGNIGLHYCGRDQARVWDFTAGADLPVLFDKNPNFDSGGLDADAFTGLDWYLNSYGSGAGSAAIKIVDGWANGPWKLIGTQSWVLRTDAGAVPGTANGLLWEDTSSTNAAQNMTIDGGRIEGGSVTVGGWHFRINKVAPAQGGGTFKLLNTTMGAPGLGGVYARRMGCAFDNVKYDSTTGVPLDIDDSCGIVIATDTSWHRLGGSPINLNGVVHELFRVSGGAEGGERFTVYGAITPGLPQNLSLMGQSISYASATKPTTPIAAGTLVFNTNNNSVPFTPFWIQIGSSFYPVPGIYGQTSYSWTLTDIATNAYLETPDIAADVDDGGFVEVSVSGGMLPAGTTIVAFTNGANKVRARLINVSGSTVTTSGTTITVNFRTHFKG